MVLSDVFRPVVVSVQEISDTEEFGYKPNTIFKKIKEFEDNLFVAPFWERIDKTIKPSLFKVSPPFSLIYSDKL